MRVRRSASRWLSAGSIQRLPATLRLTLNLVDAAELVQLGSRTIDIRLGDEVMTQDTVAGAATALLALELEPAERRAITAGGTSAPGAYQLYVQGRGYLYRFDRGADNIDLAIDALGRAVAADPRYALAHTALAEAFWRKYEIGRDASLIDRAVTHCEQALAIDSRLAPVHVTLALLARGTRADTRKRSPWRNGPSSSIRSIARRIASWGARRRR